MEADHPEELLDLVDEHDTVIDTVTRKEVYAKKRQNYRVIHAFIINDNGQLWIPRRVSTKKLYPNGLDFSIAGHVETGETYEEALIKEAREEVGMNLHEVAFKEIGYFTPHTHNVHCFQKMYEICSNQVPDYNPDDFADYEWLYPQEVLERFAQGDSGKQDIPEIIRLCYVA